MLHHSSHPCEASNGSRIDSMSIDVISAHNVRVIGAGEQYLVLGNGFGCDQSVWNRMIPYFLADFRIVLYDQTGSHLTDPAGYSDSRYSTLHGFADDLLAILEELQIKSCVYVGHSVSGMVGCIASLEKPSLFSRLFLLCASPRYLNDADSNYFGGFELKDVKDVFEDMQLNFQAWGTKFATWAIGADVESSEVQEFLRTLMAMRPDIAVNILKTIFLSDYRSLLPRLTVHCQIIQTRMDMAVPLVVADYMRQHLGGESHVEVLPMEGHFPHLIASELLAASLLHQMPPTAIMSV